MTALGISNREQVSEGVKASITHSENLCDNYEKLQNSPRNRLTTDSSRSIANNEKHIEGQTRAKHNISKGKFLCCIATNVAKKHRPTP